MYYTPYEIGSPQVQTLCSRVHQNAQFFGGTVLHYTGGTLCEISIFQEINSYPPSYISEHTHTGMHIFPTYESQQRSEQVECNLSASLPITKYSKVGISGKSTELYTVNRQQVPSHTDHRQDHNAK